MEFETILALAGAGLLVVATLGGGIEAKQIKVPSLSQSVRIVSALVGVGLLGAAYYVHPPAAMDIQHQERMTATFEYPGPNTRISLKTELRGTVRPASPASGEYWLIVRDDDGDYYPQAELSVSLGGNWTHFLSLGPAWKGRPASVLLVFAPPPADEALLGLVGKESLSKLPENVVLVAELGFSVE